MDMFKRTLRMCDEDGNNKKLFVVNLAADFFQLVVLSEKLTDPKQEGEN